MLRHSLHHGESIGKKACVSENVGSPNIQALFSTIIAGILGIMWLLGLISVV